MSATPTTVNFPNSAFQPAGYAYTLVATDGSSHQIPTGVVTGIRKISLQYIIKNDTNKKYACYEENVQPPTPDSIWHISYYQGDYITLNRFGTPSIKFSPVPPAPVVVQFSECSFLSQGNAYWLVDEDGTKYLAPMGVTLPVAKVALYSIVLGEDFAVGKKYACYDAKVSPAPDSIWHISYFNEDYITLNRSGSPDIKFTPSLSS